MKRSLGIAFLLSCCLYPVFGQDSLLAKENLFSVNAHYGFIMAHNKNMQYLIKRHIPGGEFNFTRLTTGEKYWEKCYHYPQKGVGLFFADLGNPKQLGQVICVYPFVNFPLNPGRSFKLFLRVGEGIGLVTKPFDRLDNHKNNINGSYINGYVNLRLNTMFSISKSIGMEAGLGLTHLSNGAWTMPNLGINIISVNLGVQFHKHKLPYTTRCTTLRDTLPSSEKKPHFTLIFAGGLNEVSPPNGKKYPVFSLNGGVWKNVSQKSRIGTGFDLFYEFANLAAAERDTVFDTSNKLNNVQAGIRIGYELVVSKFSFPAEMGGYVFSKTVSNGTFYHRIGLRYRMGKHFILSYTLLTHWATAENLEFGIGYRF